MKKYLLLLGAAFLAAATMSSCSNDDDKPNEKPELAQGIAATFDTNLKVTQGSESDIIENATIKITREDKQLVKMEVSGLKIEGENYPINVSGVALSGTTDNVALNYSGAATRDVAPAELKISGTIKGTDRTLTFTIEKGDKTYTVVTTDEKPAPPVGDDFTEFVVGDYEMSLVVTMGGDVADPTDATIKITATGENEVKLNLIDFYFDVENVGNINVPVEATEIKLTGDKNKIVIKHEQRITVNIGQTVPLDIELDGTVEPGKTPEMKMIINLDLMGIPIEVDATGSRAE